MDKKLRVNKQYGEWYYRKEVDEWDTTCINYCVWGTDANGKEWLLVSVPTYNEVIEFVKANDETKERIINY